MTRAASTLVVFFTGIAAVAGAHASTARRAESSDPVMYAAAAAPRAGHVFTGVYARFPAPSRIHIVSLTCDAKIGGRRHWDGGQPGVGSLSFAGGKRLRPIIRRYYTAPDAAGRRYVRRVSCGWRIPAAAAGKLWSVLPPPTMSPCDAGCTWGLDVKYAVDADTDLWCCDSMFTQATWRVRPRR